MSEFSSSFFAKPIMRQLDYATLVATFDEPGSGKPAWARTYAVPGAGARAVCHLFDLLIAASPVAVAFGAGLLAHVLVHKVEPFAHVGVAHVGAFCAAVFVVNIVVGVVCEWLFAGQTPGKNAGGLRVVSLSGGRISLRQAAVRNVARLFDFLPVGYMFGVYAIEKTAYRQRFGDRRAGTMVVCDRHLRAMLGERGLPPGIYSTNELGALVESLLARRKTLNPESFEDAAINLAEYLEKVQPVAEFETRRLLAQDRHVEYLELRLARSRATNSE